MEETDENPAVYKWLEHEAQEVADRIKGRLRRLHRAHVFTPEDVEAIEATGLDLTDTGPSTRRRD
jgi:hypothetical protein